MNSKELGTLEAISVFITIIISHVIIYLPEKIISDIGSSSIISVCFMTSMIFLLTFIVIHLFKKFSTMDILDVSYFLGGNFLKKILTYTTAGYGIVIAGIFVRFFAESLRILYFHDFKLSVIIIIFLVGSFIINRYGIRKVIRCSFIISPTILLSILIVFIANFPNYTYQRVFPVWGYGIKETFFKSFLNISAFSNFIMIFYAPPFLKNKKSFGKIAFISMGLSGLIILCTVTTLLLSHNFSGVQSVFSIYLATRSISIGSFLQRPDSLFILFWILSMFSYLALIISLSSYIVDKDKRQPSRITLLIIIFSIFIVRLIPKDIAQLEYFGSTVIQYYLMIIGFAINLLILLLGNVKFKLKGKQ